MLCILTLASDEATQVAARSYSLSWIMPVLWVSLFIQLVHFLFINPRQISFFNFQFTGKLFWMSVIALAPLSLSAMKPGVALDASLQRYITLVGCQGNLALAIQVGSSTTGDWRFPSYGQTIAYALIGCHGAIGIILFLLEFFVPEK